MNYQSTTKAGVGIGAFGVVLTFLTTALLFLIPQHFMAPATRAAYIGTWSVPIVAIGEAIMVYGLPLLSITVACYLTTKNHPPKSVLTGFIVGGLVLGLGETLLGVTLTYFFVENPAVGQSLVSHVSDILGLGSRLVGGALIGILGGKAAEKYF